MTRERTVEYVDVPPPRDRIVRWPLVATVVLLIVVLLILFYGPRMMYVIPAGHRGVRWSIAGGTRLHVVYGEGLQIIPPWDTLFIYDTRLHEIHGDVTVLARDGLPVKVSYSSRFRPSRRQLPLMHQDVGPYFTENLVRPRTLASIRTVIGRMTPEEIYSRRIGGFDREVNGILMNALAARNVELADVALTTVRLTPAIERAIEVKLTREQEALAYVFRIRAEQLEAQRKGIEADGIREFERRSGISIVQWRSIEATESIAKSPNAKVIIVGTGKNQLPVLLGGGD